MEDAADDGAGHGEDAGAAGRVAEEATEQEGDDAVPHRGDDLYGGGERRCGILNREHLTDAGDDEVREIRDTDHARARPRHSDGHGQHYKQTV